MYTAILGMNFCGSTIASGLLQNIQGVFCVGEAHWLVDGKPECTVCPSRCPFFNGPMDAGNLYKNILDKSGKKHLITSDKFTSNVTRFASPKEVSVIVLFKRPEALFDSWKRRQGISKLPLNLSTFPFEYEEQYANFIHEAQTMYAKHMFLFYEDLVSNPLQKIKDVADFIGLEQPEHVLFPPSGWHNVGGNKGAYTAKSLHADIRWKENPKKHLPHGIFNYMMKRAGK